MSLGTFKKMQNHVLQVAGLGEARRTLVKEFVNKAARECEESYDWVELNAESQFNTVAPVIAGNVDVTIADATVVTGSEGTPDFTNPDVVGRKFSLGYGQPWFLIDSTTDADTFELAQAWPYATDTDKTYTIYEDVYSLAATVGKLDTDSVTLHDENGRQLARLTVGSATERNLFPYSTGFPEWFTILKELGASGVLQMQLGARAPDKVYVVRYGFKKKYVELTGDADVPALDESLLELVADSALIRVYSLPEFLGTGIRAEQQGLYDKKLKDKIRLRRRTGPRGVQPRAFGGPHRGRYPFSMPVGAD